VPAIDAIVTDRGDKKDGDPSPRFSTNRNRRRFRKTAREASQQSPLSDTRKDMNAKVEKAGAGNAIDVVMSTLAVLLLIAGVFAYYYFGDWSGVARFGVLMAGIAGCVVVGAFTKAGRSMREYIVESQFELRKVVWPTRDETLRTTLVIIVVVIILSLLLGLIDVILKWVVLDHLLKLGR
jgi:preprotein translocase subunit SecE